MGNAADRGFEKPPETYLTEIRKKTNQYLKDIATLKKRRSSASRLSKKRPTVTTESMTEMSNESVKKYIMANPDILDDLVISDISPDRVTGWVRESEERKAEREKQQNDPDFTVELMENCFRQRQILFITRSHLLYPREYQRNELNDLIERPYSDDYVEEIETHLFPYTEVRSEEINKVYILMVNNLLGKYAFPMPHLCYFLSSLKANYHNIEYHNYNHALSHAQSMYWILRRNPGVFTELEIKSLIIASLAHDVAHPGVNDSFIKTTENGLQLLYGSPILEHHHLQTLFLILQDHNCNVFCDLDKEDYKQVLGDLQHAILSTSLTQYTVQCENMRHMIVTDLDFQKIEVRDAIKSVLMMTCDLCACWKNWPEHKSTVWALYKEFFSQGDKELNFNIKSFPQMERMNADKIHEYQVGFLENIIVPVVQIAVKVFRNCETILDSTNENLELWKTYL